LPSGRASPAKPGNDAGFPAVVAPGPAVALAASPVPCGVGKTAKRADQVRTHLQPLARQPQRLMPGGPRSARLGLNQVRCEPSVGYIG